MTKVLLERFIVHRPHPWGALVTFIELLRNPKYEFWNKDFINIAPEVTLMLQSVGPFQLTRKPRLTVIAGRSHRSPRVDFASAFLLSFAYISFLFYLGSSFIPQCIVLLLRCPLCFHNILCNCPWSSGVLRALFPTVMCFGIVAGRIDPGHRLCGLVIPGGLLRST